MNRLSVGIAVLITIQYALQSNAVEYLSGDGYSSAVILVFSSLVMLLVSTVACLRAGLSPFPVNWRLQWTRMVFSGSGLYLGTLSYQYIHATTASLIFQLNVPFIVLLTAFSSRLVDRRLRLSVSVISLAFLFFLFTPYSHEPRSGILIAFAAVAIVAFSYTQAKKSVAIENQYVIINVACLSCILVSLVSLLLTKQSGWHYDPVDIGMLVGVGILRYGQFRCLIVLLRMHTADRAQFPFLLGALATLVLEMWLEQHVFPIPYILAILVLVLFVSGIVFMPTPNPVSTAELTID